MTIPPDITEAAVKAVCDNPERSSLQNVAIRKFIEALQSELTKAGLRVVPRVPASFILTDELYIALPEYPRDMDSLLRLWQALIGCVRIGEITDEEQPACQSCNDTGWWGKPGADTKCPYCPGKAHEPDALWCSACKSAGMPDCSDCTTSFRQQPDTQEALDGKRDWPEDFNDENGNYSNMCLECGYHFIGHKRRRICKVCAGQKRRRVG